MYEEFYQMLTSVSMGSSSSEVITKTIGVN
jgi:hypothetical protein